MKGGLWKIVLAVVFAYGAVAQFQRGDLGMLIIMVLLCFGCVAWFCYARYKEIAEEREAKDAAEAELQRQREIARQEDERLRAEADAERAHRKRVAELQEEKARLELEIKRRQLEQLKYADPAKTTDGHDRLFIKVAGVTFENDDGTDRQEILEELESKIGGDIDLGLQPDTYEGEPCIMVFADGQQVGYIPKRLVSYVMENFDRISELSDLMIVGGEDGLNYGLQFYINFQ